MSRQYHILVLDDDPNLCRTLTLMLEHAGHSVTVAAERQQRLNCLATVDYDLILLDIVILDQDGRELLPRLRHCYPAAPVLVLVGQDLSSLEGELRQRGASAILFKPINPEFLVAQVEALLRTQSLAGP